MPLLLTEQYLTVIGSPHYYGNLGGYSYLVFHTPVTVYTSWGTKSARIVKRVMSEPLPWHMDFRIINTRMFRDIPILELALEQDEELLKEVFSTSYLDVSKFFTHLTVMSFQVFDEAHPAHGAEDELEYRNYIAERKRWKSDYFATLYSM